MNALTSTALAIARGFVGVREVGGNNRGKEVEAWLARVHQPPGAAWCAAFAWSVVDDACDALDLPNPIKPCASVVRLWESLPASCKLFAPVPGCWAFHRSTDDPTLGHIGFVEYVAADGSGLGTVEGNSNAEGSRTGGGVVRHTPKLRPVSYFNLGFADYSAAMPVCFVPSPDPDVAQ
jgi:hypothetical protein